MARPIVGVNVKRLSQVGNAVEKRIKGEQLVTCSASHQRHNEGHHGRLEAGLSESFLDNGCSGDSDLIEEGSGNHADA